MLHTGRARPTAQQSPRQGVSARRHRDIHRRGRGGRWPCGGRTRRDGRRGGGGRGSGIGCGGIRGLLLDPGFGAAHLGEGVFEQLLDSARPLLLCEIGVVRLALLRVAQRVVRLRDARKDLFQPELEGPQLLAKVPIGVELGGELEVRALEGLTVSAALDPQQPVVVGLIERPVDTDDLEARVGV